MLAFCINKCCNHSIDVVVDVSDVVVGGIDVFVGGFDVIFDVTVNLAYGVVEVRFFNIR